MSNTEALQLAAELRRHARKIAHPAGDTPAVMARAADALEALAQPAASGEPVAEVIRQFSNGNLAGVTARWIVDAATLPHGARLYTTAQPAPALVPPGWVPVTERLPQSGVTVLACYRNSAGKLRRIRAEWVAARTQESGGESDIGVYDEDTDTCYDPEGWYEQIDNWDDGFSAIGVHQGEVTHWMPLPAAPTPQQEPTRAEGE